MFKNSHYNNDVAIFCSTATVILQQITEERRRQRSREEEGQGMDSFCHTNFESVVLLILQFSCILKITSNCLVLFNGILDSYWNGILRIHTHFSLPWVGLNTLTITIQTSIEHNVRIDAESSVISTFKNSVWLCSVGTRHFAI